MTATSQAPARPVVSPAVTARTVLWAAVLLNVLFVEVLFFTADVPRRTPSSPSAGSSACTSPSS